MASKNSPRWPFRCTTAGAVYRFPLPGRGSKTVVNPSVGGALKGATAGGLIGARFGPHGAAVGSAVGGLLGFVLGPDGD